jgi:hypothetical protein
MSPMVDGPMAIGQEVSACFCDYVFFRRAAQKTRAECGLLRGTGRRIRPQLSNLGLSLRAIWGSGADDVYIVGGGGLILHLK